MGLEFLLGFLLFDALIGGGGALLLELVANGAVELLFKDRLGLNGLELGLEVLQVVGGGIASTTGIRHIRPNVFEFVAITAPEAVLVSRELKRDDNTNI